MMETFIMFDLERDDRKVKLKEVKGGLRRLKRGTTMLFLENFLHNKEDTMQKLYQTS